MKYINFGLLLALVFTCNLSVTEADYYTPSVVSKPFSIPELITHYSALYGVSRTELYGTLKCESGLSPSAVGDSGASYGIAQINLPSHPNITKEQALDPKFAVRFAAKEFAAGNQSAWTCWKLLYS